jgi:hypothetical protein
MRRNLLSSGARQNFKKILTSFCHRHADKSLILKEKKKPAHALTIYTLLF